MKSIKNKMKNQTIAILFAMMISTPAFCSFQNSNNSDNYYGDINETTTKNNVSSTSTSRANSSANNSVYTGVGVGVDNAATATGGNGGTGIGTGGSSNSSSTGGSSNASNGNVNNSISTDTNIPRNAPPAVAPTMVGAVGTNSYSAGVSTILGGVSIGKSTTTKEGKDYIKAQTAQLDIENLQDLDNLDPNDAAIIRRSILRRYK